MVASTWRLPPRGRPPSPPPPPARTPQLIPPLAVAKNEPGRVLGRNRSCWAIVDVDSVTNGESAGVMVPKVDHTASGSSGADPVTSTAAVFACLAGTERSL